MRLAVGLFAFAMACPAQTFEVASVRPHPKTGAFVGRSQPLTVSGTLIRLEGYTLFGLLLDAWNLHSYQLRFAPSIRMEDVADTQYDVVARAPGETAPRPDEARIMLQKLLTERFRLQFHFEKQERSVYSLQVGKRGARLTASEGTGNCAVRSVLSKDGRNNEETFTNCPIDRLAERLTNLAGDHAVLDRTGLTGRYDFRLLVVPENRRGASSEPVDISPLAAVEQLGLTLVQGKAQIDILTVDHIEKPGEN